MMALSLRLAQAKHISDVRALLHLTLTPIGDRMGIDTPEDAFGGLDEKVESRDLYIATEGDVLIAACVLSEDDSSLKVDYLAIHPDYQKKGLGSEIMREIEMIAESREIYNLRLHTPEVMDELISFYGAQGYRETSRQLPVHGRDSVRRVHFEKTLIRHGISADMDHEHDRVLA